jgi:hypothetical protein
LPAGTTAPALGAGLELGLGLGALADGSGLGLALGARVGPELASAMA